MPRTRQRVRLQDGLWLDLNQLLREGLERHGKIVRWTSSRSGEIANGALTFWKESEDRGFLRIVMGNLDQRLDLLARPRHFGGQQWYFKCPVTQLHCSVVWLPPGASRFCSRQAWGKQVAYSTQFEAPFDRAIAARQKVKRRLIADLNPREWDLPPKPKWMRWDTYERLAEKYKFQQGKLDQCMIEALG
ncbi:MAG: hypothetical protein ABW047_03100 [Nitrospiraceae bacterium]